MSDLSGDTHKKPVVPVITRPAGFLFFALGENLARTQFFRVFLRLARFLIGDV